MNYISEETAAKAVIKKGEEIAKQGEFLNCEFFCNKMIGGKGFKEEFSKIDSDITTVSQAASILKAGDVLAFGGGEDTPPRHYAVYVGGNSVYEVDQWGSRPREFSLSENLNEYGVISAVYRSRGTQYQVDTEYASEAPRTTIKENTNRILTNFNQLFERVIWLNDDLSIK